MRSVDDSVCCWCEDEAFSVKAAVEEAMRGEMQPISRDNAYGELQPYEWLNGIDV